MNAPFVSDPGAHLELGARQGARHVPLMAVKRDADFAARLTAGQGILFPSSSETVG